MKKVTLAKIFFMKEGVHWRRMGGLFKYIEGLLGILVVYPFFVILLSFFHYAFAFMHTAFEIVMWMFKNEKFKENMQNIHANLIKNTQ